MRTQLWKCFGNTTGVSLYFLLGCSFQPRRLVPAPPIAYPVTLAKSLPLSEPEIPQGKSWAGPPSFSQGLATGMMTQHRPGAVPARLASSSRELVNTCVYAHVCVCECTCVWGVHVHMCVHKCVCVYVCVCV